MRRAATLCILLLAAAGSATAGEATPLDDALAAFEAGDYAKAAEAAEAVPAEDPESARARYVAGEARLVLGDAAKAEEWFRFVLERKPKAGPALVGLGRALTAQAKHEEAEKRLREAVAADAKDATAHRALGELLTAVDRLDEAKKALQAAQKLAPDDPFTARALVVALVKTDAIGAAEKTAAKLTKAMPKHPMGPFLEALVLEKRGKDDEAIEKYEAALARDEKFLDAHKNLAILCHTKNPLYQNAERTKKAMEHYARYFELGGADATLRQTYETLKGFVESQQRR
jgi:tetratricopeptide (TPR) repeat protein